MRNMKWTLTLTLVASLLGTNALLADSGHEKKTAGPHGGEVSQSGSNWYEVVFKPKGINLYLYDAKGKPVSAKGVRGSVVMMVKGNSKQYRYDLYPDAAKNAAPNSLALPMDLSKMPEGAMSTKFSLFGLPKSGRKPVVLSRTFWLSNSGPTKSTQSDAQAIAFQKICPVTGGALGSMGAPIKMRVSGRDVFVCCKGCVKKVKSNPSKYLVLLPSPKPAKATKADAAAIARQKDCPVMDESLNEMGGPWKVYAKGQPLFVCCKGCIKKIQKNPNFYLAKVTK